MWREIFTALVAVVMFWNVENLFDPFDDPLKNDGRGRALKPSATVLRRRSWRQGMCGVNCPHS